MNQYCPICGIVHDRDHGHHHHQVQTGLVGCPESFGPEEREKGGQASADEGDDDPAPQGPGPEQDRLTIAYLLSGLCCQKEAEDLKGRLAYLPGVDILDLDPVRKTLTVTLSADSRDSLESVLKKENLQPSPLEAPEPTGSIAQAGLSQDLSPAAQTVRFHVPGLCCNMEVNRLQDRLGKIFEVKSLDFNLNERVVTVGHSLKSQEPLIAAFKEENLPAEIMADEDKPENRPTPWKRLIVATLLAFLAEGLHWNEVSRYVIWGLSAFSFIITGFEVYKEGLVSFRHLRLDMNALMSLAVTGAVVIGEVAEGAMVLALFSLAEALEDRSLSQARAAIAGLLALAPDKATIRTQDGQWRQIQAEEVPVGTIIQLRPGEKLPLDGRVVSGYTAVDQAPVTGESIPVDKNPGDMVFAGTINGPGSIEYETTALFKDSTLAKVASFVEATEAQKAPVQRLVDRFAAYYTPSVFGLAALVALIPPLFYGQPWGAWAYKALVLLVISCPCALVISVPVTILCGLAAAARKGLIIKGGAVLEQGRKLKIIALDKTGTITTGRPRQTAFSPLADVDPDWAAKIAASLAARSDHPVSKAVFQSYRDREKLLEVKNLMAYPGKGIGGTIEGREYFLGSSKFLAEGQWPTDEAQKLNTELTKGGQSVVLLFEGPKLLALMAVADTLKEDSLLAIRDMKEQGLKTVMLTGDNEAVARAVALEAGVDDYYAELLPEEKAAVIAELKKDGVVGMAGDGINDAPALALADIGLAMAAAGTDVAIETAQVAIMDDKLNKIPAFVRLTRAVWQIVVQNFIVVFGVKLSFLTLTMLGVTYMWMAIIADIGVCMIVVANGLRAMRK
ncbi:MAG: cation-translocating P-type ATPase [Deltaproteobacteria bacterium]|jgi:Cd2+/Zn2+-exporting ATPase|nr:cation-translocating P-type ATPase [Deltaproteobacteria bacterium]